jgi:hypothetical protein
MSKLTPKQYQDAEDWFLNDIFFDDDGFIPICTDDNERHLITYLEETGYGIYHQKRDEVYNGGRIACYALSELGKQRLQFEEL